MYCILDNCPHEYETMIKNYFIAEDVEFIRFNGAGNLKTFGSQIEILLNQKYSEIVFFAEDDYIYRKGTINSAIQLIKKNPQAITILLVFIANTGSTRLIDKISLLGIAIYIVKSKSESLLAYPHDDESPLCKPYTQEHNFLSNR